MTLARAAVVIGIGAATLAGCATTLMDRARTAAETGTDPGPLIAELQDAHDAVDATKRIFDVSLLERGRRFMGEGALLYAADPRRLRADVFGPHDTAVLHVRLAGDTLTVVLPQEGEVIRGELGDPRFAELTGERALVSPEVLGAMLGAYDVGRLVAGADRLAVEAEAGRRTLFVVKGSVVHALTADGDRLVEYRQERDGRPVYRVRFDAFLPVDGRESPRRVVLRDFVRDRQVVVDVRSERAPDPEDLQRLAREP